MREIKFRAWQPHNSLHRKPGMYMVSDLIFYDGEGGGGEAFLHKYGEMAKSSEYLSDINLMQYTGLKDKNGVEIYEGDIVRFDFRNSSSPKGCYQVRFGDYMTAFEHTVSWVAHGSVTAHALSLAMPCEVIGNIYENPELLK